MIKSKINEVQVYFSQVVQLVGQRIGIGDAMWKSSAEVLEQIEKTNEKVINQLKLFFHAYEAWWEYDMKQEEEGKMGKLTTEEFKERDSLISKRDFTRNTLIEMLP